MNGPRAAPSWRSRWCGPLALALLGQVWPPCPATAETDPAGIEFFERKIRPVLVEHCYACHSAAAEQSGKLRGGLLVDSQAGLARGGDSGPAVVPGKPEESPLLAALRGDDGMSMPPKGRLSDAVIKDFSDWLAMGAPDPRTEAIAEKPTAMSLEEGRDFWAFRPVQDPPLPPVQDSAWPRTSIDHFILARLEAAGLRPAADADRRTLLRRVTFDLTGLPPTPAEMDAFLADESPDAFANVVDRLLASPRYGERWGRHWLDLARYADTSGNAADFPVPQARLYRDWVIRAFNRDLPYDQFVREQIAGDLLAGTDAAERADRIVATGYLAICRRFGNGRDGGDGESLHLMYEDTIDNVGRTVLGQTLACARCHDHKFDPFTVKDYYGLYGIFNSTQFPYPGGEVGTKQEQFVPIPSGADELRLQEHRDRMAALDAEIGRLEEEAAAAHKGLEGKDVQAIAAQDRQDAVRQLTVAGRRLLPTSFRSQAGATAQIAADGTLSVGGTLAADTYVIEAQLPEAARVRFLRLETIPDPGLPTGGAGRASNGNFVLGKIAAALVPTAGADPIALRFVDARADFAQTGFPASNALDDDPESGWAVLPHTNTPHVAAFELAEETVMPSGSKLVVTIEQRHDNHHALGKLRLAVLDTLPPSAADSPDRAQALAAAAAARAVEDAKARRTVLQSQAPVVPDAYAVSEGKPGNVRVHVRGEPERLGDVAPRRLPAVLGGQELPAEHPGSGRLELAAWLTDPKHPLTARVMVNRIWQHHFGKGIVATPNDFGRRGEPPTHPELLDHLATRFIEGGWSIKSLHRQILLSRAWQMSGTGVAAGATADPANDLLWRFRRRRLDAESIRDTMLFISGLLDERPGGDHPFPPPTSWKFTQHEPFAADYETRRRSVYIMQQRSRKDVVLALFDGADPNASTAVRFPTTTPLQALFFLNAPLAHEAPAAFAARVLADAADESGRIDRAYSLALNRTADAAERAEAGGFLAAYRERLAALKTPSEQVETLAWTAFSRALWSGNEFVYVD